MMEIWLDQNWNSMDIISNLYCTWVYLINWFVGLFSELSPRILREIADLILRPINFLEKRSSTLQMCVINSTFLVEFYEYVTYITRITRGHISQLLLYEYTGITRNSKLQDPETKVRTYDIKMDDMMKLNVVMMTSWIRFISENERPNGTKYS